MEITWADHGEEYAETAHLLTSRRFGYSIYVLHFYAFREEADYDLIGNDWLSLRIHEVKAGSPLPERYQDLEVAVEYNHITIGNRTFELEIKARGEAMYGGSGPIYATVDTIRAAQ